MPDFYKELNESQNLGNAFREYSALTLAYLGDAVFELCVRNEVVTNNNLQLSQFNTMARNYVKAPSQAKMYRKILGYLDEEEARIMKRGRNAKSVNTAKNADVVDYRHATGLEALFGYLFLSGKNERLMELFKICLQFEKEEVE